MTTDALSALHKERYINLETYRKDGGAVLTPVWFERLDDTLVVMTNGTSFKVKRLRRNGACRVAACTVRGRITGPFYEGNGEIVTDKAVEARAFSALERKYGWQWKFGAIMARLGRRRSDWVALQLRLS